MGFWMPLDGSSRCTIVVWTHCQLGSDAITSCAWESAACSPCASAFAAVVGVRKFLLLAVHRYGFLLTCAYAGSIGHRVDRVACVMSWREQALHAAPSI